jgi:iron(III) transport system ATP-binding protein
VLVIQNLIKSYAGRQVLADVSLTVRAGDCLALVGPSGCGKTTLLRLIAGLDDADAGIIAINGQVASNPRVRLAPHRRRVGMVFQDLALWPHLTACQNVEFMVPAAVRGRKVRMARARQLLAAVQLDAQHGSHPHQLSRGQQQRVALARTLAGEPAILLLDEPFASQDSQLKAQMADMVREIRRANGITTVYVTHTTEEIPRLADRVVRIETGTLGQVLSLDEFQHEKNDHDHR